MRIENINIRYIMNEATRRNAIIIDVRDRKDFLSGHIPMAINIPLENVEKGEYNLPINKTLILYCETGASSLKAARILVKKGYNAISCVGGVFNYGNSLTKGS